MLQRQSNSKTYINKQTDRQAGRQAGRQTDWQTQSDENSNSKILFYKEMQFQVQSKPVKQLVLARLLMDNNNYLKKQNKIPAIINIHIWSMNEWMLFLFLFLLLLLLLLLFFIHAESRENTRRHKRRASINKNGRGETESKQAYACSRCSPEA